MRLLDRYIAKTVLAAISLVALMLAGLQIFILFVSQLDEIGKANYGMIEATQFVLLHLPYQVYLFFPMASLLGCLIGLGVMANHRELVVMRAAGMSIAQITLAVLKAALIVIVLVTCIGETLVPKLAGMGNDKKMQALSGGQSLRTPKGVWLRYQNDFINIGAILPNNHLVHVYQFQFDDGHHLRLARHLDRIDNVKGSWEAEGVAETRFYEGKTTTHHQDRMSWDVALKPTMLGVGKTEVDDMTLQGLYQYMRAPGVSQQMAHIYKLAFFKRLIQPLTTVVMMVLAIPFIFGPLRSSTMGSKLLAGASVGFGFHIINHFFGPVSQVFQWPAEVAAFGPTVVFAILGLYLMRRVK